MREGLQCRISRPILKHCLMKLWNDINQLTFVFPLPKLGQLMSVYWENLLIPSFIVPICDKAIISHSTVAYWYLMSLKRLVIVLRDTGILWVSKPVLLWLWKLRRCLAAVSDCTTVPSVSTTSGASSSKQITEVQTQILSANIKLILYY